MHDIIHDLPAQPQPVVPRRQMLRGVGIAAAAILAGTGGTANQSGMLVAAAPHAAVPSDLEVLNFLLMLEHLNAAFYAEAVASSTLTDNALTILTTIRSYESAHVDALTTLLTALGGTPVRKQSGYSFGDLRTQEDILGIAENLALVGVGAYAGQMTMILDKFGIVSVLARIVQVEARQHAALRVVQGKDGTPSVFGPNFSRQNVLGAIAPYLGT